MRARRLGFVAFALTLAVCRPTAAQTDEGLSFRPFLMISQQRFAAEETFDAAFGQRSQTFFGGGLNITQDDRAYLELTASRFEKTGEQAFLNAGTIFRLGIPMSVTITPFEMTAGYRFHRRPKPPGLNRRAVGPSPIIPYIGGGIGLYRYEQTSKFATDAENVDTQHAGVIVEGGVELRLQRFVGIAIDGRYTYVPDILGEGGISQLASENNLGGIAVRVKVIVGR